MLEFINLTKSYRPKKGVRVQALRKISLSFGETGLVFVLGKSGSGKSTLLNLVGGLDSADSGEIIIKGRSSKDFDRADFDAYRNTYIGFVFQEYNILNEFTVGENVMLALELQNKQVDRRKLDEILKEVDLEGYAHRKPNELSGGQKQRVAIARALVKNPNIIMADEPTGALDSSTGKAIFDTFKKISKEKLVIVVSHDREFAEEYGDRVIELADGEVISDLSKGTDGRFSPTDNQEISKSNCKYDGKEKFVKSRLPYRHAFKMGATSIKSKPIRLAITILLCFVTFALFGVVDAFNAYDARQVLLDAYNEGKYSHLAFTTTIKDVDGMDIDMYGMSQEDLDLLNTKSSQPFVGVTYLENKGESEIKGFLEDEKLSGSDNSVYYSKCLYGFFPASKELFDAQGFELTGNVPTKENEIVLTQYVLDQMNFAGIELKVYEENRPDKIKVSLIPDKKRTAKEFVDGEYYIDLEDKEFKIVGIVDTKADPQGVYDSLKPSTMSTKRDTKKANLIRECEEYFQYGYHALGYISPYFYQSLVKSHSVDMTSWGSFGRVMEGKYSYSGSRAQFSIVASDKDLDKTEKIFWLDGKERETLQDNEIVVGLNMGVKLLTTSYEESLTYKHYKSEYFDGLLKLGEWSVSFSDFIYEDYDKFFAYLEEAERVDIEKLEPFKNYIKDKGILALSRAYSFGHWTMSPSYANNLEYDFEKMSEAHWRYAYAGYLSFGHIREVSPENPNIVLLDMDGGYFKNFEDLPLGQTVEKIGADRLYVQGKIALGDADVIDSNEIRWFSRDCNTYQMLSQEYDHWSIVGIYVPRADYPEFQEKDTVVFNNALYNRAEGAQEMIYNFALAPTPTNKKEMLSLIDLHLSNSNARSMKINNNAFYVTSHVNSVVYNFKVIMLIAGVGVALFSILLMSNYIATSIANRKREIGILRALGAKTSDVFSIFVNESIIMALINAVLSTVVAIVATLKFDKFLQGLWSSNLQILNFGIRQVAIILLISVATAVLSSLVPIYRLSKKKPIDCIQDR